VGGLGGILAGHAIAYLAGSLLGQSGLVTNPLLFNVFEPAVLLGVMLLGTIAGLLPALLAYRTEVVENLAPLS
jgi:putative ABC transport system permease protein